MTMKMVSLLPQILMQQLPTILMSTQDVEMSFIWTPPRRRTMLDMMVLLDSSGTRRGLYNNLLMLLRKHSKKGFDVTKAKCSNINFSNSPLSLPIDLCICVQISGSL
jgi:hypothetical protein